MYDYRPGARCYRTACADRPAAGASSIRIRISGRIASASTAPISSRMIEPMKGAVQLPVWSMIRPNRIGEMMPASAEPALMMPLAVPA